MKRCGAPGALPPEPLDERPAAVVDATSQPTGLTYSRASAASLISSKKLLEGICNMVSISACT